MASDFPSPHDPASSVGQPAVPTSGPPATHAPADDGIATVIPYKNPSALAAYYLGLAAVLPCIGIVFGIPAFILGILGLRARRRNPLVHGSVHAWIGIVLGGLMVLIWGACILFLILGILLENG